MTATVLAVKGAVMSSQKTPSKSSRQKYASQLFLCHSHRDKPFARRLGRDLTELGVDVWLDEWELAPGDSLHECIGVALETVAYVGVIMSPSSIRSRWCRAELYESLAREKRSGKTIVLPLLYRRVNPPHFLADRLYANFSRHYFTALVQLAAFVHDIPQRAIADNTVDSKVRSVSDARQLLVDAGWKGTIHVGREDWRRLKSMLAKFGVHVDKEFDILRLTTEKLDQPRNPPMVQSSRTDLQTLVKSRLDAWERMTRDEATKRTDRELSTRWVRTRMA